MDVGQFFTNFMDYLTILHNFIDFWPYLHKIHGILDNSTHNYMDFWQLFENLHGFFAIFTQITWIFTDFT